MSTLIVVANGSEARLLTTAQDLGPRELQQVARLARPVTVATRPGSAINGHDRQLDDVERFARRISRRLEALRRDTGYDEVVVIAAPRFLGMLRSTLTGSVRDLVSREIPQDLVRAEERRIWAIAFE